jgi:monosaccharide-transporting ATPase
VTPTGTSPGALALEVRGVSKQFGGNPVLTGIDFELARGEVHALLGENGAGKSTLTRIIGGVVRADDGEVLFRGAHTAFRDPGQAVAAGISTVYQELNLIPTLDVAANILLGRELSTSGWLRRREMHALAREALDAVGSGARPDQPVAELSTGERQLVEIARALSSKAEVIIMDEPTAALSSGEIATLHAAIRRVTALGVAVIYISHKLDEVRAISDRVSVLRDGALVRTARVDEVSRDEIVSLMLGRGVREALEEQAEGNRPTAVQEEADPVLSVRGLTVPGKVADVSFDVRPGEILGFAGLVGAGRTETMRAMVGLEQVRSGEVHLGGRRLQARSPRAALRAGLVLIPEDRKTQGLILSLSTGQNVALPHLDRRSRFGWVRGGDLRRLVTRCLQTFEVRPVDPTKEVRLLSGGNQQKVLIGRQLLEHHRVVVFDEPSKGVDVGARAAIWDMIRNAAREGTGVVVVSSETEELIALCDRIAVMREGSISTVLDNDKLTEDEVMQHAF